jgi:hypothetical protein
MRNRGYVEGISTSATFCIVDQYPIFHLPDDFIYVLKAGSTHDRLPQIVPCPDQNEGIVKARRFFQRDLEFALTER